MDQALQQRARPLGICGLPNDLVALGFQQLRQGWHARGRKQNAFINETSDLLCDVGSRAFGSSVLLGINSWFTVIVRFIRTLVRCRGHGDACPLNFGSGAHERQEAAESYKPNAMDQIAE